jgi:hypothetical protein
MLEGDLDGIPDPVEAVFYVPQLTATAQATPPVNTNPITPP